LSTGIINLNVQSLAVNSSGHIFAGVFDNNGSRILRSTNDGSNWNYTSISCNVIRTMSINTNGHIFIGTDSTGILRSTDNGLTFIQVNNGLTFRYIRSIAVNSSGVLFAATHVGGVFRSTNNGENWTQVNTGLTNLYVNSIAVNPVSGYIFIGTGNDLQSGAVYRSTNNGGIWTIMTLTDTWVTALTINSNGTIFAGVSLSYFGIVAQVKKSTDGGGTWSDSYNFPGYHVNSIAFNNADSRVYAGTSHALYRSINQDMNFEIIGIGISGQNVKSLIKTSPNSYICAGTDWSGIFRTTNGGLNWSDSNWGYLIDLGLPNNSFANNSFGSIYGGSIKPIFNEIYICKSTDEGNHFDMLPTEYTYINSEVNSLAVNYLDYVFAGTLGDGILRSIDNGGNWTQITLSNNNVYSLLSVNPTTSIFAGTGGGKIFRSTDNGFGFNQVYASPLSSSKVKVLASDSNNVVYAGLDTGGILISTDNGNTWTQSTFTYSNVNVIIFSSNGNIFVGTGENGVYQSIDNGSNWNQINTGLTNTSINALVFDNNNYLYCGTNGSSVFRTVHPIGIQNLSSEIPNSFSLQQNYPNPFNPSTQIEFSIPYNSYVKLTVFDIMGREISVLVNEKLNAGTYKADFDGSNLSSGIYFYKLEADGFTESRKMMLIK